jgi:glucose/arabinose dehydrogenase
MNVRLLTTITLAFFPILLSAQSKPPPPKKPTPWLEMDYGPVLAASIESPLPTRNMTQKGLAIRVNPAHEPPAYVLFDMDLLRYSAGWTDKLIDWKSVLYDASHRTWPSTAGQSVFGNPLAPGWADSAGRFTDPRTQYTATDYKPLPPDWQKRGFGPLPKDHARYRGLYFHGNQVILSYTVHNTPILDSPGMEQLPDHPQVFTRTLNTSKSEKDLILQVFQTNDPQSDIVVAALGASPVMSWQNSDGAIRLHIPASATPAKLKLLTARTAKPREFEHLAKSSPAPLDLSALTQGGPPRHPRTLTTTAKLGTDDKPYTVDTLAAPTTNPWKARMRFSGLDFFPDGKSAALCTWDGDVWLLSNLDDTLQNLTWKRIATGLHQPLGLKILPNRQSAIGNRQSQIIVSCRDQIVRLHDFNVDDEIDFLECLNTDHQVTEHFHEFAMGLQTDADGNFYYAKSARHALDAVVPHHGTIIKVSADGSKSEILASGFRAANGIGIGPSGELAASDQEGFWTPANRINLLATTRPGRFFGNMWSYHATPRTKEQGYDAPLCFIPQSVDRSPAEELWVTSDKWGPLKGNMLHISYGAGKLFLVPYEIVGGVPQGGVVPFDLSFTTGIMRGRFNPSDGQLYLCGLFGWSSNTSDPGGLYRVRYTNKPVHLPRSLHVTPEGLAITFTNPLDKPTADDTASYALQRWNYRWTEKYGSPNYSLENPNKTGQDEVEITAATLSPDAKTILLKIKDHKPAMQLKLDLNLKSADGTPINLTLHHTINVIPRIERRQ